MFHIYKNKGKEIELIKPHLSQSHVDNRLIADLQFGIAIDFLKYFQDLNSCNKIYPVDMESLKCQEEFCKLQKTSRKR